MAVAGNGWELPRATHINKCGQSDGMFKTEYKKLTLALEKKGFIRLLSGSNNSVCVELTDKVQEYSEEVGERHLHSLKLLFEDFSEDEIETLFRLYMKLYAGIERVEKYAEEISK